jgi:hypothetical protein
MDNQKVFRVFSEFFRDIGIVILGAGMAGMYLSADMSLVFGRYFLLLLFGLEFLAFGTIGKYFVEE